MTVNLKPTMGSFARTNPLLPCSPDDAPTNQQSSMPYVTSGVTQLPPSLCLFRSAVNASSFDAACTVDSECVGVASPCGLCPSLTLSTVGQANYEAALAAEYEGYILPVPTESSCPPLDKPSCNAGRCSLYAN